MQTKQVNKGAKRVQLLLLVTKIFDRHECMTELFTAAHLGLTELKGLVHDNAHARRLFLQNIFVGSTLNSNSPLPVQSLKILRFIRTSVALVGLVILR